MTTTSSGRHRNKSELTTRQAQVLAVLESFDSPPTYRELAKKLEISGLNAVRGHMRSLERKGYVMLERGSTARGIKIIPPWWRIQHCVIALAEWLIDEMLLIRPREVLELFEAPDSFDTKWQQFCEARPEVIEMLQAKYRWRCPIGE